MNEFGIGCIHQYLQLAKEIWVGRAYCGWSVFFAPALIEEVLVVAASLPKDWVYDPADEDFDGHHAALIKPLCEYERKEAPNPDWEFLKDLGTRAGSGGLLLSSLVSSIAMCPCEGCKEGQPRGV